MIEYGKCIGKYTIHGSYGWSHWLASIAFVFDLYSCFLLLLTHKLKGDQGNVQNCNMCNLIRALIKADTENTSGHRYLQKRSMATPPNREGTHRRKPRNKWYTVAVKVTFHWVLNAKFGFTSKIQHRTWKWCFPIPGDLLSQVLIFQVEPC